MTMVGEHLPKVRDLCGLTSNMVMLRSVGALLRMHYKDVLQEPLPEHFEGMVRQLRTIN
jgi:hypothetical protein